MRKRFLKNDKGNVMVEYALVAPMFFLTLIGMFEVSALFFVQTSLEAAVFQASRFGRTGDTVAGQTQEETMREIISDLTYNILDPSRLHIRIAPVADFSSANVEAIDQDSIDFGGPEEPVVYTVTYDWPMITQLVMTALGSNEDYQLTASSVIMNEPF